MPERPQIGVLIGRGDVRDAGVERRGSAHVHPPGQQGLCVAARVQDHLRVGCSHPGQVGGHRKAAPVEEGQPGVAVDVTGAAGMVGQDQGHSPAPAHRSVQPGVGGSQLAGVTARYRHLARCRRDRCRRRGRAYWVGVDGTAAVVEWRCVWLVPVPGAPLLAPQPAVSTTRHAAAASPAADREILMAVSLRSRPMSTVPLFSGSRSMTGRKIGDGPL